MKQLTIQGKVFGLDQHVYQFISDYVRRVEQFVTRHRIDVDLHQDILQMLSEKLSSYEHSEQISQTQAIQIVKELGEPEEIFSELECDEEVKGEKTESHGDDPFYVRLQRNGWSRSDKNAVFLGVGKLLADKLGISVFGMRLALVLFSWFGFVSVPLYILAGIILPRTNKDYGTRSVFSYFLSQVWSLRLAVVHFVGRIVRLGVWRFVGYCFWILWSIGFFVLAIGVMVLTYLCFFGSVWMGMEMGAFLPAILPWGVLLGWMSVLGLFVWGILMLFSVKKSVWLLIASLLCGVLGLGAGMIGVQEIGTMLANMTSYEQTATFNIPQFMDPYTLKVRGVLQEQRGKGLPLLSLMGEAREIKVIPTQTSQIKAVYRYEFFSSPRNKGQKNLTLLQNGLQKPQFTLEGSQLSLGFSGDQLFSHLVPYVPFRMSIDLYVPENMRFTLERGDEDWASVSLSNVRYPERASQYRGLGSYTCNAPLYYRSDLKAFYCAVTPNLRQKKIIAEAALGKVGEKFVPFKGNNSEFSWSEGTGYWMLSSMRWLSDDEMLAKFSDRFFNVFVAIKTQVSDEGKVSFGTSHLVELEQKGLMNPERLKAYPGLEHLSGVVLQMQDSKQELQSQIQKLSRQLETLEEQEDE